MQMHTESVRKMSPLIKFLAIIFSGILVYSAISMFFTQPVIKVISVPVPKSEKVSFEFGVDNKIDAISISFLITEKVPVAQNKNIPICTVTAITDSGEKILEKKIFSNNVSQHSMSNHWMLKVYNDCFSYSFQQDHHLEKQSWFLIFNFDIENNILPYELQLSLTSTSGKSAGLKKINEVHDIEKIQCLTRQQTK